VAPDVIRAVLPPPPKGAEPKPTTRQRKARASEPKAKPAPKAQPKPTANGGTTDKERMKLAVKVVQPAR
jgi:hypothetical protein